MWFLSFSMCKMRAQPQVFIPTLPLPQETSQKLQWRCQFREQCPLFHVHSELSVVQFWSLYWPKLTQKKSTALREPAFLMALSSIINYSCVRREFFSIPLLVYRQLSQLWIKLKDLLQSPVWAVYSECKYLKCHNFIFLPIMVILQDSSLFSLKEFPWTFPCVYIVTCVTPSFSIKKWTNTGQSNTHLEARHEGLCT